MTTTATRSESAAAAASGRAVTDDAERVRIGRKILATQPFSVFLGAELTEWSGSRVRLELPMRAALQQQFGFAHGGVLSYLADNALTFAGGGALSEAVLTAELKINYLRPALGERLIAEAEVLHAGKTQAVCRCEIYAVADGQAKLCAAAQGTIVRLPGPAPLPPAASA